MTRDHLLAGIAFRFEGHFNPISGHSFALDRHYGNLVDQHNGEEFPLLAIGDDSFTLMKSHLAEKKILFSECKLINPIN